MSAHLQGEPSCFGSLVGGEEDGGSGSMWVPKKGTGEDPMTFGFSEKTK